MGSAAEPTIEHLRVEARRIQSMLRMLEGNTTPQDIKKLQQVWLDPITERLRDVQSKTSQKEHEGQ